MARIQAKVLEALQRIYRYVPADRSPGEIEIDLGIQVVHDAGPDARFATGQGPWQLGWNYVTDQHNHVGVGTITTTFVFTNPGSVFQGMPDPYDRSLFQQWIYGGHADVTDAADFGLSLIELVPAGDAAGYSQDTTPAMPNQVIFAANIAIGGVVVTGNSLTRIPQQHLPIPVVMRPGGNDATLIFRSTSAVAGTLNIDHAVRCWLGSRFVMPPGM